MHIPRYLQCMAAGISRILIATFLVIQGLLKKHEMNFSSIIICVQCPYNTIFCVRNCMRAFDQNLSCNYILQKIVVLIKSSPSCIQSLSRKNVLVSNSLFLFQFCWFWHLKGLRLWSPNGSRMKSSKSGFHMTLQVNNFQKVTYFTISSRNLNRNST